MKDVAIATLMKFFESSTTKSIVISLVMGIAGFTGHAFLQLNRQDTQIAQHTQQLDQLTTAGDVEHKVIQDMSVIIARIEGKIDVLNQKIDDDRARHR